MILSFNDKKMFFIIFLVFLCFKAKGNSRHRLSNPGLSKNFLKIKIKLALLKQKFLFPKNHDIFSLIKTIDLTKTKNKIKKKYLLIK